MRSSGRAGPDAQLRADVSRETADARGSAPEDLDARAFTSDLAELGASSSPPEIAPYYDIAAPVVDNAASPPAFVVRASAQGGTMQAVDGDLSIDSAGRRSGHW